MSGGDGLFFGGIVVFYVLLFAITIASYVFGIWAIVELAKYREDEFQGVGLNRTAWMVVLIIGLVVCQPMGLVAGLLFLLRQRPRLAAWRQAHPYVPVWYPAPGWPPPGGAAPPGAGPPAAPGWPPPGQPAPPGPGAPPASGWPPAAPPAAPPTWPAPAPPPTPPSGWAEPGAPGAPGAPPADEGPGAPR